MNIDQSLEVLRAQFDKAQAEATGLAKAIEVTLAAQEAEAGSKKAVRERAKLETDLEKFRKDTQAQTQAISAELQEAKGELERTKTLAVQIQQKQREDYANAEREFKTRAAAFEVDRNKLLADKLQLQQEIVDLTAQKKRLETLARSMLAG